MTRCIDSANNASGNVVMRLSLPTSLYASLLLLLTSMFPLQATTVSAETNIAIPHETKLNTAEAISERFERKTFDFKANDINFSSYLPKETVVETVPEKLADLTDQVAFLKIIASARWSNSPLQVSALEYQTPSPVSALRVCSYEAEINGYSVNEYEVRNDLAVASIYATKPSAQSPSTKPFYGKCYTRGNKVIGVYVLENPKQPVGPQEHKIVTPDAATVAGILFGNLEFTDGKNSALGADIQNISLRISEAPYSLTLPKIWGVKLNDFEKGSLPAELILWRDEGRRGVLWFGVREEKAPPNMERMGKDLLPQLIKSWAPDGIGSLELVENREDPELKGFGLLSHNFRYLVTGSKGEDKGDVQALFAGLNGRVYGLVLWSPWRLKTETESEKMNLAFSRMPGLTTYDAFKIQIIRMARFKSPQ